MTPATPPTANRPTPKFASYWFDAPKRTRPATTPTIATIRRRVRACAGFMNEAYDARQSPIGSPRNNCNGK